MSVLFDNVFNRTYANALYLQRQEQCVLVSRVYLLTPIYKCLSFGVDIGQEGVAYLVSEVQNGLISAFSRDGECVGFKIYIAEVEPHTLADTDTRTQKQRYDCVVARSSVALDFALMFRHTVARFRSVEYALDFFFFQDV